MKFYLSSYKIGNDSQKLKALIPQKASCAYISNARDFASSEVQEKNEKQDMNELEAIGLYPRKIDLRVYFGKKEELYTLLLDIDLLYISGGNVFDLMRAMYLSGFDDIIRTFLPTDKVYSGYSAAGCVLSKNLKGYDITDTPDRKTYGEIETPWKGIGLIDWQFVPHFESDHPESDDASKEVQYYKEHGMEYKTLKDGEVMMFEIK